MKRNVEHEILPLLAERWSPRAYSPDRPAEPILKRLFEAARWAPSSSNEQPWVFLSTRRGERMHELLLETLVEANRRWAKDAPVLVLGLARTHFARSGKPNRHAFYDLGQAVAHLTVEAAAAGLAVHQMAGFDVEKARGLAGEGMEPVVVFTIGYPGDPSQLPADLAERELRRSDRKAQAEFVFADFPKS